RRNAAGKQGIVGMFYREGSGCFSSQVVQLGSGDAVVKAFDNLFSDVDGGYEATVEAVAEFFNTGRDLVELHGFLFPVSFDDEHINNGLIVTKLVEWGLKVFFKAECLGLFP